MSTTASRKVQPHQITTTAIVRGWHVWNDYAGDMVLRAMQQDDSTWTLTRKGPEDGPGQNSIEVASGMKGLAQVRAAIAALYNGEDPQAVAEVAPARRKAASALSPTDEGVKVGDFYYTTWGYEQTNVEFYEVVGLTPKGVKVRKVSAQVVEDHTSQEAVVPVAGAFLDSGPETKVLRPCGKKGGALSFSSYKSAWFWDGTPKYRTASGWGH